MLIVRSIHAEIFLGLFILSLAKHPLRSATRPKVHHTTGPLLLLPFFLKCLLLKPESKRALDADYIVKPAAVQR